MKYSLTLFSMFHRFIALVCMLLPLLVLPIAQAQEAQCGHKHKSGGAKDLNFETDPRSDSIDILHTKIDLSITNFVTKFVSGHCSIEAKAKVNGISRIRLDLKSLEVDSVVAANGGVLSHTHVGEILNIQLQQSYLINESFGFTVYYKGIPGADPFGFGGMLFNNTFAYNIGVSLTLEPHNFGRVWYPCFDNFTERSTYEITIRCQPTQRAICGGVLVNESVEDGLRVQTWQLNQPTPSYLISVAVSNYAEVRQTFNAMENESLPVLLHAPPADTTAFKNSFQRLPQVFNLFEEHFGPYRWDRVGFVAVPFQFGAMEHATNVAYPRFAINGNLSFEKLMVHELAHSWFGNLATCRTASEMWLNEGFASYTEYLSTEWFSGSAAYANEIRELHRKMLNFAHVRDQGYWALSAMPGNHTYGTTTYEKGADVLHTLRSYVGDSAFYAGIRYYLNENTFKDVSAEQLRLALEQASGLDLQDFFDDWVYQPGWAAFAVDSFSTQQQGNQFVCTVYFKQRIFEANQFYNQVPMQISFFNAPNITEHRQVMLSGETMQAQFNLPFAPQYITLNRNEKISQACTADERIIKNTALVTFPHALFEITPQQISDSAWVRVEHFWVAPDGDVNTPFPVKLSPNRFWRVDGLLWQNLTARARINFNGRTNSSSSGWLDHNLVDFDTNVVVLYRPSPGTPWSLYPSQTLNTLSSITDRFGFVEINELQKGEYTLAIRLHNTSIENLHNGLSAQPWLFPNPADQMLQLKGSVTGDRVRIFDALGKMVSIQTLQGETLPIGHLDKGLYLLELQNSKGQTKRTGRFRKS